RLCVVSRPAPVELLADLAQLMSARRWRWYVFGAQAAIAYGRPRLTADVDVTVDIAEDGVEELLQELNARGFALRFSLSEEHLPHGGLLPLVHGPTSLPLDLVVAAAGLEQEFLARATLVDVGGVEVPLMSVEDLLAVKVLAGRRKDLEDVRGVLLER